MSTSLDLNLFKTKEITSPTSEQLHNGPIHLQQLSQSVMLFALVVWGSWKRKDSPKMSHMKGAGCIWLPCFRSTGNKQAAGKALHHSSQSVQSTLQKHTACASHRSARATPSTENSLGFIPRPSSRVSQFSTKTDLVVFWGTNFSPPTGGFRYTSCIIPADLS